MNAALWTQIGIIVTGLLTLTGVLYSSRSSRWASERTTDTQRIDLLWKHDLEMQARVGAMQTEIDRLHGLLARQGQLVQEHIPWDITAVEELRKKGIRVTPPPPLTD